jgi:hypothetical protein
MEISSAPENPPPQMEKPPQPKWARNLHLIIFPAAIVGFWLGGFLGSDIIWNCGGAFAGVMASLFLFLFLLDMFPNAFPRDPNQQDTGYGNWE